ncbi:hypothetical protein WJR50_29650 [Catalinimonas sp. 4WD22]|uniref:hypothetical protein n=1 Tax=Catalinimonas locisalis TaxID=3133978 RepID=UPI0031018F44
MKFITTIAHILLGLIFVVFGLNGLYTFIPVPKYHPFMEIMVSTEFIAVVKVLEIIGGLLLIIRRYTLLALLILGPIVVNILLYHLLIDHRNMVMGFVNLLLYGILIYHYRGYFEVFLTKKPITSSPQKHSLV